MDTLQFILRLIDRLSSFVGTAVSVLLPALTLVLTFEVVARYFFERPTIWAFDMAIFMFGYLGLLAGAYVMKEKEHITVDLIYGRFSPRGKAVLDVITG